MKGLEDTGFRKKGLEDTGFREKGKEDTGFLEMGMEDTGTHSLRSRRGSTSRLGTLWQAASPSSY